MTAALSIPLAMVVPGTSAHWAFVRKTWLLSYATSDFARPMRLGVYHKFHGAIVDSLLRRGELRIASPRDDADVFLGWAMVEPGVVHYVYVKPEFRKLGISRQLLEGLPSEARYTHLTPDGKRFAKHTTWAYCPYLL